MGTLETVLFLLLGWLFGLLSPIIVDSIKRRHEIKEVKVALIIELQELQYTLMGMVFLIADHTGKYDRKLLEWMRPIAERYEGIHSTDSILKMVKSLLTLSNEQLAIAVEKSKGDSNKGLSLKKHFAPLLDSKIAQLGAFDQPFQNILLEVRSHLNMINEQIEHYYFYFNKTFDSSLTEENRVNIGKNMQGSYNVISEQARIVVDLIEKLSKK